MCSFIFCSDLNWGKLTQKGSNSVQLTSSQSSLKEILVQIWFPNNQARSQSGKNEISRDEIRKHWHELDSKENAVSSRWLEVRF